MALGSDSSAIYLQAPSTAAASAGRAPTSVTLHPAALFSILDHYLRRADAGARVIGTLLGARRTERDVAVRAAFAVLHGETDEQVAVDMEYHRTVLEMHARAHPKDTIVGWYSAGPGASLNTFSALIQNFYAQEAAPHQAVHVAVDTGAGTGVKAYISSPVGVVPKPENCVFVPLPCELAFHDAERSGLDLLVSASKSPTHVAAPQQDLEQLENALRDVLGMLERVTAYVKGVLSGEIEGNVAVGRYLMDTLNAAAPALEKGKLEALFNTHLQDTLMISYLGNLVRSQVEVSSRLALLT